MCRVFIYILASYMQIPREIRLHTGMLCDMFLNNVTAALPRLYLVFTLSIRHNCCPLDWSRLGVDERHVTCSLSSVTPGASLTTSIRTNLPLHRSATADRRGLAFNVLAQHKDPGALQDCLRSLWVYARVMLVTSATVIKKVAICVDFLLATPGFFPPSGWVPLEESIPGYDTILQWNM